MLKRVQKIMTFIFTVIFLIIAIYNNELFKLLFIEHSFDFKIIKPLLNTDGLSLIALILSIVYIFLSQSYFFRKILNFIILKFSIANINYTLDITLKINAENELQIFEETLNEVISKNKKYKDTSSKILVSSKNKIQIFYKGLASIIDIQFTSFFEDEDEENIKKCKISLSGTTNFRTIEENIRCILHSYLEKLPKDTEINKISFTISKKDSELSIANKISLSDLNNFKVLSSSVHLETTNGSNITFGDKGLSLTVRSIGEFVNAFEDFKYILIN